LAGCQCLHLLSPVLLLSDKKADPGQVYWYMLFFFMINDLFIYITGNTVPDKVPSIDLTVCSFFRRT
jgi:hypothetical protein